MSIQSQPVKLGGGVEPDLPYRFEPPLSKKSKLPTFSSDRDFFDYITRGTVFLALAAWAALTIYMLDEDWRVASPGAVIVYAFGMWLLSMLALRGTIPALIISSFFAFVVFSTQPPGITLILIAIFGLSWVKGVKLRFFTTEAERQRGRGRRSKTGLTNREQSLRQVWGVPGAHIAANKQFGELAEVGARGEVEVGKALQKVVDEYPWVRVFHGLNFTPGQRGADVDHAVVIGNEVVLVDAKNWAYADYSWGYNGEVLRDGQQFQGGDVHMESALFKWADHLDAEITGISALVTLAKPPRSQYGKYTLSNGRSPRGLNLTTTDALVRELKSIASSTEPVVDRRLVYKVSRELQ